MSLFADMNPMPLVILGGGAVCAGIALSLAIILGGLYMFRRSKLRRAKLEQPPSPEE